MEDDEEEMTESKEEVFGVTESKRGKDNDKVIDTHATNQQQSEKILMATMW